MKIYRGAAAAARNYVEADRSRADDYYLAEGSGLAQRYVARTNPDSNLGNTGETGVGVGAVEVVRQPDMDGPAYETWVSGHQLENGKPKGRLRHDDQAVRFVEVTINGPKTWSLAAALHPEIGRAYDAAQQQAAEEIIGWLAENATTRIGPRGRQVQVPVEEIEAAVVRHFTSRAGDPHRHLHLQINARVYAAGGWRGLHTVGVRDSLEAINGIGHAAVMTNPGFRAALAAHGYTLNPQTGEVVELAPYVGAFSARARQIATNIDTYEATWRSEHPGQEPGPVLRQVWDRRAWAQARPDKVTPTSGEDLRRRWVEELHDLGFHPPQPSGSPSSPASHLASHLASPVGSPVGSPTASPDRSLSGSLPGSPAGVRPATLDRDQLAATAVQRLGARHSAWNPADLRGETEKLLAATGIVLDPAVRRELVEDLTHRALTGSVPLLARDDVPGHIRSFTSTRVLAVEHHLDARMSRRAAHGPSSPRVAHLRSHVAHLSVEQCAAVALLADETTRLVVVEGAAGAGKTATLAALAAVLADQRRRLLVLTPTRKAAQVAATELTRPGGQSRGTTKRAAGRGPAAVTGSAAWLLHQHGYRWDTEGHWTRVAPNPSAPRLSPRDLLVIDEAGMLDQDTALALFELADATGAHLALLGDRHQLPAVGRGGVLDLAIGHTADATASLEQVHRFTDPTYADLSLQMRQGVKPGEVFDQLAARGQVLIHASDVERTQALAQVCRRGELVIADTSEQVATLNAVVHQLRHRLGEVTDTNDLGAAESTITSGTTVTTAAGERIGVGDRVVTRRNDPTLGVTNRETWTVIGIHHGEVTITAPDRHARAGTRTLPAGYATRHLQLSYATTTHGAQGTTVPAAHLILGDHTGAASAYVAMTRGRETNTVHLVASDLEDARNQWIYAFNRDRADLGPAHAAQLAAEAIATYGPTAPRQRTQPAHRPAPQRSMNPTRNLDTDPTYRPTPPRGHGIGI